jgi:hypothetical protein
MMSLPEFYYDDLDNPVKPLFERISRFDGKVERLDGDRANQYDIIKGEMKYLDTQSEPKYPGIDGSVVNLEYVRSHQNGYKASSQLVGQAWFPVSNVRVSREDEEAIAMNDINVNAATYKHGLALLPKDLGRGLRNGDQVLQRAPGQVLPTQTLKHHTQLIEDPSGRGTGQEGIRMTM